MTTTLAEPKAPVVPASGSDDDFSTYLHRQLIGYLSASIEWARIRGEPAS